MQAVLSAVDNPRRREILRLCWAQEQAAGEIHRQLGDVTFGAVSQHLRVLAAAGLVRARRQGRNCFYRADQDALGPLRAWLETTWNSALYRLQVRAELAESRRGPRPYKRSKRRP